ncbi:hypothetical protein [Pectobacterium brasiliense]|uniref:hypothetical protein n=1 Tax=Pectobacterium brasiliense TaxID=180957 RepID=UPI00057D7B3E|nr:hypothetical protein [Pectobacterium brasiliense]KHS87067.1 hypothetical protein RC83_13150 [Pectobacterium brasiliense]
MKYVIAALMALSSFYASANQRETYQTIDSYAKIKGMCATYAEMSKFQQKEKIKGGDDFIGRFLISEGKRLELPNGVTMVDICLKNAKEYDQLYKIIYESN